MYRHLPQIERARQFFFSSVLNENTHAYVGNNSQHEVIPLLRLRDPNERLQGMHDRGGEGHQGPNRILLVDPSEIVRRPAVCVNWTETSRKRKNNTRYSRDSPLRGVPFRGILQTATNVGVQKPHAHRGLPRGRVMSVVRTIYTPSETDLPTLPRQGR